MQLKRLKASTNQSKRNSKEKVTFKKLLSRIDLKMSHEAQIILSLSAILGISLFLWYSIFTKDINELNREAWGRYAATFDIQNLKDYSSLKISYLGLFVSVGTLVVTGVFAAVNAVLWIRQAEYNKLRDARNDERDRHEKIQSENQLTIQIRTEILNSISSLEYIRQPTTRSNSLKSVIYSGSTALEIFAEDFESIYPNRIQETERSASSTFPATSAKLTQIAVLMDAFLVLAIKFENESIKLAHIMLITAFPAQIYEACDTLHQKAVRLKSKILSNSSSEAGDEFVYTIHLDEIIRATAKIATINNYFREEYISRGIPL